jgi:RNA polymerase sigma-70 factor (ECF subfamily)
MAEEEHFSHFIQRIRAGDGQAAAQLLQQYEPAIRLEVRMCLKDPRLRRVFDSLDICQSVLGSFFVRAAAGQYDLKQPEQLLKLLVSMVRHKVASHARRHRRQKRDQQRVIPLDTVHWQPAAPGPTPSEVVAGEELLQKFRQLLTEEERRLADLRAQDRSWVEIAAQFGGTPQARRMQFKRAVERVIEQLGLD